MFESSAESCRVQYFFPFLAFEIIFETQHYIMKKLMFTLALSALVTMGVQAQKQMGGRAQR